MNVKAVVKVMNFHALLRVDAARREADKLSAMEEELSAMMRIILSNRNLRLDKKIRLPDPKKPVLRIYIGSDFGFCGSVNTGVLSALHQDSHDEKLAVGKKLRRGADAALFLTREEFAADFARVRRYLERAVLERPWSAVELIYNHYYDLGTIRQERRRIYPMEAREPELESQWDDFVIEGDVESLLNDMTVSCLAYEVKIAAASAWAAENVLRQAATSESLKKLDEMEEEEGRRERKAKNQAAFRKTIDSYVKQKSLGKG